MTHTTRAKGSTRTSKVIRSIEDLFLMMRRHGSSHFIYRGEDKLDYKLRPKFGR